MSVIPSRLAAPVKNVSRELPMTKKEATPAVATRAATIPYSIAVGSFSWTAILRIISII